MEYFKNIKIKNLEIIKEELLKSVPQGNLTRSRYFSYSHVKKNFPTLIEEIEPISKVPVTSVKIFITAPHSRGLIHLDDDTSSRIGLNIPIFGCENTKFIFFKTEESNLKTNIGDASKGYGISLVPKDFTKIKKISELELLDPFLIRTDIFHQAVNYKNTYRIIATLRWEANRHLFNFEDFINFNEILSKN